MATVTTRDKVKTMLTESGMNDNDAEEILAIAIPEIESISPQEQIIWDEPASEYSDEVYSVLWVTIKDTAKGWIKKNRPFAWYRHVFD
jgi:hypothetical protein